MLKVKPPNYKFCPFCASRLETITQERKKRKFCSNCNWTHYPHVAASAGAIVAKKGKVLLVKRARNPFKNTWMFPAGFLDFGEHPTETVEREIKEETGLTVNDTKLVEIFQSEDDPRAPGHLIFFYKVSTKGKVQNLDKKENERIEWFGIKNPPKIGWKAHKHVMKNLQRGKY